MNMDILETAKERVTVKYMEKAGVSSAPVGFDPTIIITIITTLLSMCKKSASDIKADVDAEDWKTRMVVANAVRREMRQEYGAFGYARYNGAAVTDTILESAQEASEMELRQLIDCC